MSGIIRVTKNDNYFTASNEPFIDQNLSWEARGVIGYLLSKPNKWECRNEDLVHQGPAGGSKVQRILDELKEHGYLRRYKVRKSDGTFDWVTEVYESKSLNPDYGKPELSEWAEAKRKKAEAKRKRAYAKQQQKVTIGVLSTSGLSTNGESPHIVNTESSNTELLNTDSDSKSGANAPAPANTSHSQEQQKPEPINAPSSGKLSLPESDPPAPSGKSAPPTIPPAVAAYRSVANRFPDKATWEAIAGTVGDDETDLDFWRLVVRGYILCGWNKINISGMLEFFEKKVIPTTKPVERKPNENDSRCYRQNGHQRTGRELAAEPCFNPFTGETVYLS